MFSFGKKTGLFSCNEDENSPKDTWKFSDLFADKHLFPHFEHHAFNSNNKLKLDPRKNFICRTENKIIHRFEGETHRPIVPLPTSLVSEIVSLKEGRIHALEEKILYLQNEFQKTKITSNRELKRLWSLSNNCMKRRKQSTIMQIKPQKTLSSPNVAWGRRGQLISLMESIKSLVKSANNSRENIFPRWNHRKSIQHGSSRVTMLTNDLEVQLWVWMERIEELEKEIYNIKCDRDNMQKLLEQCYKESKEIEDQIMSLQLFQAKEDNETKSLSLGRNSIFSKVRFDTCIKSEDVINHRLLLSLKNQKNWIKILQSHHQEFKKTMQTLERDKIEKNQILCTLETSKVNLNDRMNYLEELTIEAKEYASKLDSSRENFDGQVNEWKTEATEVWKEILRVERTHQLSLCEIERLRSDIQELKSKCSVLEEEKLNLSKKLSFYEEHNNKEKKDLEIKISILRTKLKSTKLILSKEMKSRIDMEEKLTVLNESKIELESNFKKETEVCCSVLKELQVIKDTFEKERTKFESTREILEARSIEEKKSQTLRIQKLLDELEWEKQKHNELRIILEDEKKRHNLITEIESCYNRTLQEKEHLSQIIAENGGRIQIQEEKIMTLDLELSSEKLKLKSMTESYNEEIAKNEKIHKILHDLTAEALNKERLIKSITDDLKSKNNIESQLRFTNEKLEENMLKSGNLLAQLEEEKSKRKDLTKRCEDLMDALSREKSQCLTLNEKLLTVESNLMEKIQHLQEELSDKNLKIDEDVKTLKRLNIKLERLNKDLKDERLSHKTELESMKVINLKLKKDLHKTLSEAENYKMKLEEMSKTHDDEIKKLRAEVTNEQWKFKNANEKTEELQLKLKEILTKSGYENDKTINMLKELATMRENEEFIQKTYQEKQKEIEGLKRILENEKFKRLQAEKDIKSLMAKLEELQNIHSEDKETATNEIKELTSEIENRELMNQDLKKEILCLKVSIEDHHNQEISAQEKFQQLLMKEREIIQAQINENKLLKEEIRKLKTEGKHSGELQIKNQEYEDEIKCLKLSFQKEQSNRIKAEEEIEKLSKGIVETCEIHMKEKMQIQHDLKHIISENAKKLADEQKKYKEMEERLIMERDALDENLQYIGSQDVVAGSYGDGGLLQGSWRTDEKIKGIIDYHERLADKMCLRNISEAASIRKYAGIEILQLREELMSLKCQLLAEKT